MSEKVSSVRVMTSAPDRATRATNTVRATTRRWICRCPRRGAAGSIAPSVGDDSGEGNEEGGLRCESEG